MIVLCLASCYIWLLADRTYGLVSVVLLSVCNACIVLWLNGILWGVGDDTVVYAVMVTRVLLLFSVMMCYVCVLHRDVGAQRGAVQSHVCVAYRALEADSRSLHSLSSQHRRLSPGDSATASAQCDDGLSRGDSMSSLVSGASLGSFTGNSQTTDDCKTWLISNASQKWTQLKWNESPVRLLNTLCAMQLI